MPKKNKIYCGIGDIPADKVRGSAKECLQANQIRYYGRKKISKTLLENKDLMDPDNEFLKLKRIEAALRGMSKKLNIEKSRKKIDQNKLDKLKKKIKKTIAEYKIQQVRHKKAKKYMSK